LKVDVLTDVAACDVHWQSPPLKRNYQLTTLELNVGNFLGILPYLGQNGFTPGFLLVEAGNEY